MAEPKCCVDKCNESADFEVLLYDEYIGGETFEEQDYTCPFLCEHHKDENEARARGSKRPRDVTDYPFSNRHGAQGVTKYRKL